MPGPKLDRVKKIADAVLYEGYLLYPYRPSALKNQRPWTFGRVYPRPFSEAREGADPWFLQTEFLVLGSPESLLGVRVRFLQPATGEASSSPWREPVQREVVAADLRLSDLLSGTRSVPFAFPPSGAVEGAMEVWAGRAGDECFKLTLRVANHTPLDGACPDGEAAVLPHTLVSAHAILDVRGGEFVSLLDPPEPLRSLAAGCRNVGAWPVLAGDEGARDLMLAAPIILPDYPRVAPESPGDLFDGTELDELLTLRILTLTEQEKREMRGLDEHTRALLDRTEALDGGRLLGLHGAMRNSCPGPASTVRFKPGDRVRLRPRGGADAFDLVLAHKTATVASVEQDYEGRVHLAVTVDEDPGKDLGEQGKTGHRFFFRPEEVELLAGEGRKEP
jgi:hydrogenase maturation protease